MGEKAQETVRLDRYLWSVRIFRTRSKATTACKGGAVSMAGRRLKPAYSVKVGDVLVCRTHRLTRTLKVTALLKRRVGAPVAVEHYDDLTPESEYEKLRSETLTQTIVRRDRGAGRPTKRQRREMEAFLESLNLWDEPDEYDFDE